MKTASQTIVVTGTDTGVGKTVFSAGLTGLLGASYWKPIQIDGEGESDAEVVARLGNLSSERIVPERYRRQMTASPGLSAERSGIRIDADLLDLPNTGDRPLVIEAADGPMVPLNGGTLFVDVFERWRLPVVLCASTALSAVNHSLLSIEALRKREIRIVGVAFIGDRNAETQTAIREIGRVRWLGRLPWLSPLTANTLQAAFEHSFQRADFEP